MSFDKIKKGFKRVVDDLTMNLDADRVMNDLYNDLNIRRPERNAVQFNINFGRPTAPVRMDNNIRSQPNTFNNYTQNSCNDAHKKLNIRKPPVPERTSKPIRSQPNTSNNYTQSTEHNINNNMDDQNVQISIEISKKPEEVIGSDTILMEQIIKYLTNPQDRKNVEMACKDFYFVCNKLAYYPSLSKSEYNEKLINFITEDNGFEIDGKKFTFYLSDTFHFDASSYTMTKKLYEKFFPKMDYLCISGISLSHLTLFNNLSNGGTIVTVEISLETLKKSGLEIFNVWSNLKPINFHIGNECLLPSEHEMTVYDNDKLKLPSTIKNIFFGGNSNSIKLLSDKLKSFEEKHFNTFIITIDCLDVIKGTINDISIFKIIPYFERVTYFIGDFILDLMDFNVAWHFEKYDIISTICISFSKSKFGECLSFTPDEIKDFDKERNRLLTNEDVRFLAQPGVYKNIVRLIIEDKDNLRKNYHLSPRELKCLRNDLSHMEKLRKLEIDVSLFNDYSDLNYIVSGINSQLNYLRLNKFSTGKFDGFNESYECCRYLEYLYLDGVGSSSNITISRLMEEFKNLRGIKIVFDSTYKVSKILDDLEKKVNGKRTGVLKWPKIEFLNIIFSYPYIKYRQIFETIEKNTPRKMGKFLMREIEYNNTACYEIVLQHRTTLYDEFEEIFDIYSFN